MLRLPYYRLCVGSVNLPACARPRLGLRAACPRQGFSGALRLGPRLEPSGALRPRSPD